MRNKHISVDFLRLIFYTKYSNIVFGVKSKQSITIDAETSGVFFKLPHGTSHFGIEKRLEPEAILLLYSVYIKIHFLFSIRQKVLKYHNILEVIFRYMYLC